MKENSHFSSVQWIIIILKQFYFYWKIKYEEWHSLRREKLICYAGETFWYTLKLCGSSKIVLCRFWASTKWITRREKIVTTSISSQAKKQKSTSGRAQTSLSPLSPFPSNTYATSNSPNSLFPITLYPSHPLLNKALGLLVLNLLFLIEIVELS